MKRDRLFTRLTEDDESTTLKEFLDQMHPEYGEMLAGWATQAIEKALREEAGGMAVELVHLIAKHMKREVISDATAPTARDARSLERALIGHFEGALQKKLDSVIDGNIDRMHVAVGAWMKEELAANLRKAHKSS